MTGVEPDPRIEAAMRALSDSDVLTPWMNQGTLRSYSLDEAVAVAVLAAADAVDPLRANRGI